MEQRDEARSNPSTGELLKELGNEVSTLVRQEVQLAKAELTSKGRELGAGGAMFAVAAVAGLGAFGALVACLILALSIVLPATIAAIVVTVVFGAIAAIAALAGRSKVKQGAPPVPEQAIESTKEDVQWAKSRLRSAKR